MFFSPVLSSYTLIVVWWLLLYQPKPANMVCFMLIHLYFALNLEWWDYIKLRIKLTIHFVHYIGHLLSKLAEKQLQFQLVSNPFRRSIIWRMKRPSVDSLEPTDIIDTQESKGADCELQEPSSQVWRQGALFSIRYLIWLRFTGRNNHLTHIWQNFSKNTISVAQRAQHNGT